MDSYEKAVSFLRSRTGRSRVQLTGNATSAIYIALRTLRRLSGHGGKVIVPVVTCANPAYAAVYAGYEPLFCDVDLSTYNLSTSHLKSLLESHKDVRALIMVHLYGRPCDVAGIQKLTRERNIFLIEDAAQALGARYEGQTCGSLGDVSILSFGPDKILGLPGGGAILYDRGDFKEEFERELALLPLKPKNHAALLAEHRKFYYEARDLELAGQDANQLFSSIPEKFRQNFLFQATGSEAALLAQALPKLDTEIELRTRNAETYQATLIHPLIEHPSPIAGTASTSSWWRYSFLYKGADREEWFRKIRSKGIDVSPWYPAVHRWFEGSKNGSFPNGERLGREVVNLWTIQKSPEQIRLDCETVLKLL